MAAGADTAATQREAWPENNHARLKSSGPSPDHKQASKPIRMKHAPPSPVAWPSMASSPLHCIQGTLRHPDFQHNGEYHTRSSSKITSKKRRFVACDAWSWWRNKDHGLVQFQHSEPRWKRVLNTEAETHGHVSPLFFHPCVFIHLVLNIFTFSRTVNGHRVHEHQQVKQTQGHTGHTGGRCCDSYSGLDSLGSFGSVPVCPQASWV